VGRDRAGVAPEDGDGDHQERTHVPGLSRDGDRVLVAAGGVLGLWWGGIRGEDVNGDLHSIIIDPEFQALIPPLSADERSLLEASIAKEGVRDALRVWNRKDESILLDGHNRHAIASALGLVPDVEAVPGIETRDDAIVWIIRNQLGRRNLSDFVKVELAMRMAKAVEAKGKANQKAAGGDRGNQYTGGKTAVKINRSEPPEPILARQEIAKAAGVSMGTVERARIIKKIGVPELQEAVRAGDIATSAGARLATLPADEQRAVVAKGPDAARAKSSELRREMKRDSEPPAVVPIPAPSSRPDRPKSAAMIALDAKVQELTERGYGTGDIAKEVGADPHRVSESKRRLGMTRAGSGNPLAGLTETASEHAGVWAFSLETLNHKMGSATQQQRDALSDELKGLLKAVKRLVSVLAKSEERETESC
jgi:hypothetical protein